MSTDLLTCKQIHQSVSKLVREAGGRLIWGSGGAEPPRAKQQIILYIFVCYLIFASTCRLVLACLLCVVDGRHGSQEVREQLDLPPCSIPVSGLGSESLHCQFEFTVILVCIWIHCHDSF